MTESYYICTGLRKAGTLPYNFGAVSIPGGSAGTWRTTVSLRLTMNLSWVLPSCSRASISLTCSPPNSFVDMMTTTIAFQRYSLQAKVGSGHALQLWLHKIWQALVLHIGQHAHFANAHKRLNDA